MQTRAQSERSLSAEAWKQPMENAMKHTANMNNRDLICCGHRVSNNCMSADDLAWAAKSTVIKQDKDGRWYHTLITDRDRKVRQNYWNPDTGPWRKGVTY